MRLRSAAMSAVSPPPKSTPRLPLDAQPQHFQLLKTAEGRSGHQVAVELQPCRPLTNPRGARLVGTNRDTERGHELQQREAILPDVGRESLQYATGRRTLR